LGTQILHVFSINLVTLVAQKPKVTINLRRRWYIYRRKRNIIDRAQRR